MIFKMAKQITIDKDIMFIEISKLIAEGSCVTITAKGYSMNPFLYHLRDQITLGPWTDKDIRKGTVALVRDVRGNVLIHRIIRREGHIIYLEGDGNIGQQEKATLDGIAGIMHSITRKNRIYTSKSLVWRIYSWLWMALRPLRRYPLILWRKLHHQPPLPKPQQ
jgi:hypothetical protein